MTPDDLIRELRPEDEPLRPQARRRAQLALRAEIAYERKQARRRPARLLATAAACGLAAAALAVAVVDAPDDRERVAASALLSPEAPRGDQYLYTRELLVETDPQGRREQHVDELWHSVSGRASGRESESGRSWYLPPADLWPPTDPEALEAIPTDPDALRDFLLERSGPNGLYVDLMRLLRSWAVEPPGLRAAAFEAVSSLPGVRIEPDAVDARGRRGLGITRPGHGLDLYVVVDPETYAYLGFRDTLVRDDGVTVRRASALVGTGVVDTIGERP